MIPGLLSAIFASPLLTSVQRMPPKPLRIVIHQVFPSNELLLICDPEDHPLVIGSMVGKSPSNSSIMFPLSVYTYTYTYTYTYIYIYI